MESTSLVGNSNPVLTSFIIIKTGSSDKAAPYTHHFFFHSCAGGFQAAPEFTQVHPGHALMMEPSPFKIGQLLAR